MTIFLIIGAVVFIATVVALGLIVFQSRAMKGGGGQSGDTDGLDSSNRLGSGSSFNNRSLVQRQRCQDGICYLASWKHNILGLGLGNTDLEYSFYEPDLYWDEWTGLIFTIQKWNKVMDAIIQLMVVLAVSTTGGLALFCLAWVLRIFE